MSDTVETNSLYPYWKPDGSFKPFWPSSPVAGSSEVWTCNSCGEKTSDISPLGPVGVVICEDCANPRNPSKLARQYMRENDPAVPRRRHEQQ